MVDEIFLGWPPHMFAVVTPVGTLHLAYDVNDPPTLADDGPPGTRWQFTTDDVAAHLRSDWQKLYWYLTGGSKLTFEHEEWVVPEGLYSGGAGMAHHMVTLSGKVQSEIWMSSFSLASDSPAQDVADAVAAHKLTIGQWIADSCQTGVTWDGIKVATYDPATGARTGDVGLAAATIPGAVEGTSLPTEVAIVLTLRTAHARVHGRMFFPCPAVTALNADGTLKATVATELRDKAKLFFNALSSDAIAAVPEVFSRTGHITRAITTVDVGNVCDAQRRRRNRLVEARVSAAL